MKKTTLVRVVAALALVSLPAAAQQGGARGTTGMQGLRPVDSLAVVTLGEAFTLAAQKSTDLRVAAAQVRAMRANVTRAWASLLPNIALASNLTFNTPEQEAAFGSEEQFQQQALLFSSIAELTAQSAALNPDPVQRRAALERAEALRKTANDLQSAEVPSFVIQPAQVLDGNLTIALPLFSGRALPLLQGAYGTVEIARLSAEQAKAAVLWGVAQAYLQAVATKSVVAIANEQVVAARRHHALAEERAAQGLVTALAVERAFLDVKKAEQQAAQARGAERMAKGALGALLGRVDDFDVVAPPSFVALDAHAGFDALLARAWQHRLDLRVQKEAVQLAERTRTEAWMRLLPSFNLIAQGRYTTNTAGLISEPFTGAVIVQGSVPIFDGGLTLANIEETTARLDAELLRVRQVEETVERELRGSLDNVALKQEAATTTAAVAELARKQAQNAADLFAQGVATDNDVRDARLGQFAADVDATRAALDLEVARLGLAYATGELAARVDVATVGPDPVVPADVDAAHAALDRIPSPDSGGDTR
jgi:outer membrane protein